MPYLLKSCSQQRLALRERRQSTGRAVRLAKQPRCCSVRAPSHLVRPERILEGEPRLVGPVFGRPQVEGRRRTEQGNIVRMTLERPAQRLFSLFQFPSPERLFVTKQCSTWVLAANADQQRDEREGGDDRSHVVYDTPIVRIPLRTLCCGVLALLLGAGSVALAGPSDPKAAPSPSLRWLKGHNILDVQVLPEGDTRLDPKQPVELLLDDGHYFRVRWAEPVLPDSGMLRIRLPRVAARGATGWTLSVEGRFCATTGPCADFEAETVVPKGPRLSGIFSSVTVPPHPVLAPPTLTPQQPPAQSIPLVD